MRLVRPGGRRPLGFSGRTKGYPYLGAARSEMQPVFATNFATPPGAGIRDRTSQGVGMRGAGLVVFGDDWGRHSSSVQHLVSHLVAEMDVTWVNTIGMRRVRLDRTTLYRGLGKFREWTTQNDGTGESRSQPLRVLKPVMWPGFGSRSSRWLNRALLERCLRSGVPRLKDSVVLTTIPVISDLVGHLPVRRWVYYRVDDFSLWPGLDGETLRSMEISLVTKVDDIVAAGDNLAEGIRALGRAPKTLSHGVDLAHWRNDTPEAKLAQPVFGDFEAPLVLFWGLVDARLDVDWLAKLGERMQYGTIGLVGPEQEPNPNLRKIPRVRLLGPIPFDKLPSAAASADVLVMPYRDIPVTRAMQPLKLKEYMATGKPVVARRLPATADWEDCIHAVDTAEEFADAVVGAFAGQLPASQHTARKRLESEGWAAKSAQLREWLFAGIGS